MSYETLSQNSPEALSASPIPDNVEALAKLFPSAVQDRQVDFDALKTLLGEAIEEDDKERFGLHWHGKKEARRFAMEPSLGTLRPCREESVDWDTTKNLYIEGDNLEVLKLLRKSYSGKVKMIYIDPPYNTGKDFVYQDNYSDSIGNYKQMTRQDGSYKSNLETSGRFHTYWLNMMYPRLQIARDLLTEDGVIFISIDDNEMDNLKKLCDEIIGESNFIANLVWKSKSGGANDSRFFAVDHEYLLVYAKKSGDFVLNLDKEATVTTSYNRKDEFGEYSLDRLDKQSIRYSESLDYEIVGPDGKIYKPAHKDPAHPNATWRWSKEHVANNYDNLVFENGCVYTKNYKKQGAIARSLMLEDRFGRTRTGKTDCFALFGRDCFSNPKPYKLIRYLLTIASSRDSVILDFFSGSSTTAHAVMQLNAEDGGHRKFIMVQLPELCDEKSEAHKAGYKNICEIGKERIRRAGKKIKEEAGLPGQKLDVGFRVYKLDSSNVRVWNPEVNEEDLVEAMNRQAEHLVAGRTSEDFLTEIMLKCGIDLVEQIEEREIEGHKVQSLGYGQYYACMDNDIAKDVEGLAHGIVEWHAEETRQAGVDASDTCTVFVLDQAFDGKDAAKMNFVAILEQYGIHNVKAF